MISSVISAGMPNRMNRPSTPLSNALPQALDARLAFGDIDHDNGGQGRPKCLENVEQYVKRGSEQDAPLGEHIIMLILRYGLDNATDLEVGDMLKIGRVMSR